MLEPKDEIVEDDLQEDIVVPDDDKTPIEKKVVDLDEEEENDKEFKKLDNVAFAKIRKEAADAKKALAERDKKIKEYETRQAAPVQRREEPVVKDTRQRQMIGGHVVPETREEWDALARKDWQAAVDLRAIISARNVRDEHVKQENATRSLNESKDKVIQKHPELSDVSTEKSKIFLNILDRNPEYLTMSKGPILAMRDMEDEMEALGYTKEQIFDSKKVATQNESTRVNRGSLTAGGRMAEKPGGRTVTLSKDDLEMCKAMGLDPKDYAKEKLNRETPKGAQL